MKYEKYQYEEYDYFGDIAEVDNYTRKLVKTRKPHMCAICNEVIDAGNMMIRESGFMPDEGPVSSYQCTDCLDKYLDEMFGEEDDANVCNGNSH